MSFDPRAQVTLFPSLVHIYTCTCTCRIIAIGYYYYYYRYDLHNVAVNPNEYYQTIGEIINDPRYSFATLDMNEVLFEGRRSIRLETGRICMYMYL